MNEYMTAYGLLSGIVNEEYYENGKLKECSIEEECLLKTPLGILIPKYDYSDVRSKYRNALSFYESGQLKSIYLAARTKVNSPVGDHYAEMLTFYDSGGIHRLFPLYGQIGGYWSEEEELQALETFIGIINGISFHHKISCYCFYPSGSVRSLTLPMNEELIVDTPIGGIHGRMGIAFYQNGRIESIEPKRETNIKTPVGVVSAFDNAPIGIHGDNNSLKFTEDEKLLSIKTIKSGFEIIDNENTNTQILPKRRRSFLDIDKYEMVPVEITFREGGVDIQESDGWIYEYSFENCQIKSVRNKLYRPDTCCMNCASCSGCK